MSSRRSLLSNAPPSAQRPRSSARPGTAPTTSRGAPSSRPAAAGGAEKIGLPPYEPPECPLDVQARRALAELATNVSETRKYAAELTNSTKLLGASIAEVNDRYTERKDVLRRRLEKRQPGGGGGGGGGGDDDDDDDGAELDEYTRATREGVRQLKQDVPALSAQCEEGVREVIDWGVELDDAKTALGTVARAVETESIDVERREAAARERRERMRVAREERINRGQLTDDEDEEEQEPEDDIPRVTGPLKRLAEVRSRLQDDYESKTMYQRYGLNNDYIAFKRMWHDAAYRDEKILPDATRWFDDRQDGGEDNEGEEEDEDEDLIVAGEKKALTCPLSLAKMTEPYTSAKCNHTFEKTAIAEFLGNKPGRRAICPQTGCSQEVSMKDFSLDQYMLQQIRRSEKRNEADDDDDEDDDEEEDADQSMRITSQRNIKRERRREVIEEDDEDDEVIGIDEEY